MIKANELRVGNKVIYKPYGNVEGNPVTIAGILGMKAYFNKYTNDSGMLHACQPIPITPDILEKCGFEKQFFGWNINDFEFEILEFENNTFKLSVNIGEYSIGESFCFLHQLQNLFFALTGGELEVKL